MRVGSRRQRWQYRAYGPAEEEGRAPTVLAGLAELLRRRRGVAIATGLVAVLAILLVGVTVSASGAGHDHVTQLGQPANPAAAEGSDVLPGLTDLPSLTGTPAATTGSTASTSPAAPGAPQPITTYPTVYPGDGIPATEPTRTAAQTSAAAAGSGGRTTSAPATHSRPPVTGSSSAASSSSVPVPPIVTPTYVPPTDTYTPPPDTPTPTPSPTKTCKVWLLPGVCLV